jgi:DNA-binding beta-propeller fold protein YncE/DNA-directed RNA polymerase subunit RPC12/RpoP
MSENHPDSPLTFHCPNCGAALPDPEDTSVICQYCRTHILVPPEYQPKPLEEPPSLPPVLIQSVPPPRQRRSPLALILSLSFGLLICGVVSVILISASRQTVIQGIDALEQVAIPTIAPVELLPEEILAPKSFANKVLQFGDEGSGAGKMDDSRYIALDREGNIYTADYSDGRVQKFDPTGKFLWLVNVPENDNEYTTIRDLAVGMDDRIYIVRHPDILIYNADGSPAGSINGHFPDTFYAVLDIDPSNTLYALHESAGETSLVKLNAQGEVLLRVNELENQLEKHASLANVRLAVDGLGNFYLLNSIGDALYLFDSEGQFRDKVASKGDLPGQLNFPMNVAVDGDGHVYLINNSQIQVLDSSGTFLDGFDWDYSNGSAFDLTLDLEGNLYVITNKGQILKFELDLEK